MTNQAETGDTGVTLTTIEPSIEPPKNHHNARIAKTAFVAKPNDVTEQTWSDWRQLRKTLKAAVTQTAVDGIAREADRACYSLEQALVTCCANGWRGFKADWVQSRLPRGQASARGSPQQSFAERDREESMRRWEQMTGRIHPDRQRQSSGNVVDITPRGETMFLEA